MSRLDPRTRSAWPLVLAAALAGLVSAGCRQDMHDAPRFDPLEASQLFEDGTSARPIPAGTVARGHLREDVHLYQGKDASGQPAATFPMPVDRAMLERGRERYEIFCAPCHDSLGTGQGMIVRRGYKVPASYHEERLREIPVGYFYDVITNGFGVMPDYAAQVPVEDRWAIAAHIRVLQASRNQELEALPAELQEAFHEDLAKAAEAEAAGHGEDGHGGGDHDGGDHGGGEASTGDHG